MAEVYCSLTGPAIMADPAWPPKLVDRLRAGRRTKHYALRIESAPGKQMQDAAPFLTTAAPENLPQRRTPHGPDHIPSPDFNLFPARVAHSLLLRA
jgi:hypothetical protein